LGDIADSSTGVGKLKMNLELDAMQDIFTLIIITIETYLKDTEVRLK
jgi:hypothetical protein